MRIVAIATLHGTFQHFVMERQIKLVLRLTVTAQTELRLAVPEQLHTRYARLLCVCRRDEHVGSRDLPASLTSMRGVTIRAADVVAPVLTTAEVVVFLSAGVTGQTGFRNLLRRFVLEGNDLLRITFFDMSLAWPMT